MNAVSNVPLPGLAPEIPAPPAPVLTPLKHRRKPSKLKNILVSIYAYGLLLFGLIFPFVLAAWTALYGPAAP